MNGATPLSNDASGKLHSVRPNDATEALLTRVLLAYLEQRINFYLRFGHPVRELRIDRWRRCAFFSPRTTFCRVHWESNEYGTTCWQLLVLRTDATRWHAEHHGSSAGCTPAVEGGGRTSGGAIAAEDRCH